MEKYINIEQRLLEMPASGVSVKKNNIACAIFLIIIGVVLFVLGTKNLVESDALNMTMIILGIGLFIYGIVKICMDCHSVQFFYDETGQRLKKHKVYVSTSERSKIRSMMQNRDFQSVNGVKKELSSASMLYVLATDNGDCCAVQCFDLVMDIMEPTSDVVLLTGAEAKPLCDYLRK